MIARGAHDLHFGFILAAIAVFAVVTSPYVCGQEKTESQAAAWSFVFRVVDDDGVILKDATIKSKVGKKRNGHRQLPNGDFRVTYDSKPTFVSLYCRSDGKTPVSGSWSGNQMLESSEEVFVVTLPTPKPMGGRVVDEEGDPIKGAMVSLLTSTDGQRLRPARAYYSKTDGEGKWTCRVTPPDIQSVSLRLEHPDYISDNYFGQTRRNASVGNLQALAHVSVMRKGITVSGTVVGPDGQPLPGATVYQGSDRFGSRYPETKTDNEGKFAFTNCSRGTMVLTFVAKDLAPELIEIRVAEDFLEPVKVKLTSGKTLTIKVVDPEGNPVPGARIPVEEWRGHRSLMTEKSRSRTDSNGVFQWKHAPEDVVKCDVLVQGYLVHRGVEFTAREEPYIVNLVRPLVVKGAVVDAGTGKAIDHFQVIPQIHWGTDQSRLNRSRAVDCRDGKYQFKFTFPREGYSLKIEAEGYAPQVSTVFKSDEGEVKFDFKLVKSSGITATVVSGDGEPVEGAIVALIENLTGHVRIRGGLIDNLESIPSTRTDENGQFSLVTDSDNWRLFICHDLGFAKVTSKGFEAGKTQKLSPWAVIAGRDLKSVDGKTPVVIALLNTTGGKDGQVDQEATVNSRGDFEFTRVMPGYVYALERRNPFLKYFPDPGRAIRRLKTEAGTRHQILLGQPGRKVVGELEFEFRPIRAKGFAKARTQRPDHPDGFDQWDEARRSQWQEQWSKTDAGMRYQSARWLEYPLKFTDEHHFEIEALPPGFYEILIGWTDRRESYHRKHKLHVKKIAAEEKDPQPQDLGVIECSQPSKDD